MILTTILQVRIAQLDTLFQTLGGKHRDLIPFLQRAFFPTKRKDVNANGFKKTETVD